MYLYSLNYRKSEVVSVSELSWRNYSFSKWRVQDYNNYFNMVKISFFQLNNYIKEIVYVRDWGWGYDTDCDYNSYELHVIHYQT